MKKSLNILAFFILTLPCVGQSDSISEKGFYIPKNITECNQQLEKTLGKKAKAKFMQVDENRLDKVNGFFIIGEWFDNDSTRLANYFKQFSITDWNERDLLILLSYQRQLNGKSFNLNNEIQKLNHNRDSLKLQREAEYKKNIIADTIDGIYIPPDLNSCFMQLDKLLNDTIKQDIKSKQTKIDLADYHFGLGLWMRNNWGLWGGSRLQVYFRNKDITHPDNMSGIILVGYNKYLNGKVIDADSLIYVEKKRQEEFMQNLKILPEIKFEDNKNYYSKEYRRFLRTKKINIIDVYNW
jgi:hypothetical protein